MKEFCAFRAKTYTYLMDEDSENKKAKGIKRCVIKRRRMFENYKDYARLLSAPKITTSLYSMN